MNIPQHIRTGFEPTIDSNINPDFIATIMSMVSIFSEEALNIASHYTIYQGRDTVTCQDIIKGLKLRALDNNPDYWEKPEIINKLKIKYDEYHESTDTIENEFQDTDEYINYQQEIPEFGEEIEIDEPDDDFDYLDTSIDIMKRLDTIQDEWDTFIPKDNSEIILKNAIENTEQKFISNNSSPIS